MDLEACGEDTFGALNKRSGATSKNAIIFVYCRGVKQAFDNNGVNFKVNLRLFISSIDEPRNEKVIQGFGYTSDGIEGLTEPTRNFAPI